MHDLNLLAAYVEDRLDPRERARTTAHVAACAECRATLAELVRGEAAGEGAVRWGPSGWSRAIWLPLAAVLVAGTIVGLNALHRQSPRPLVSPAMTEPSPMPSTTLAPAPSTPPAPSGGEDDDVLVKRGGVHRSVGGKTFRLVAGEWVDLAFDTAAGLPVVEARSPAERKELLERIPSLVPFAGLGPRVVVVAEGTVYRFSTPASR